MTSTMIANEQAGVLADEYGVYESNDSDWGLLIFFIVIPVLLWIKFMK